MEGLERGKARRTVNSGLRRAYKLFRQDPGDLYEFICETAVQPSAIQTFEIVSIQCQYERKYKRSYENATEQDLKQFIFRLAFFLSSLFPLPFSGL